MEAVQAFVELELAQAPDSQATRDLFPGGLPKRILQSTEPRAGRTRGRTGSGSWAIRREVMQEAIDPILDALSEAASSPGDDLVSGAVERLDADSVRDAWSRALERRTTDPEAAITAARALLEATCKTVLDDHGEAYDEGDDLPALYRGVQKVLKLSPADQTEDRFRALLGACTTVVKELGSVRNRHSGAHAAGRRAYRPVARHAALAVNLAGSMAPFLIETHEAHSETGQP